MKLEGNGYWYYSDSAFCSRVLPTAALKYRSSWYFLLREDYSRDWSTLQLKDALINYPDPLDFPKVTSETPVYLFQGHKRCGNRAVSPCHPGQDAPPAAHVASLRPSAAGSKKWI